MNNINIALISDDDFIKPTVVAITSMIVNKNPKNIYNFYIIKNYSESNKYFEKLERADVNIHIIDSSRYLELFKDVVETTHVSVSAILKFYLPLICEKLDKIIYIDGDVIVQDDFSELYNMNFDGCYAFVVRDPVEKKCIRSSKLPLKHYFNSGMMLLNLDLMRRNNITNALLNYKLANLNTQFMDQDALNVVFNENVKYLSYKYNFLTAGRIRMTPKDLEEYYGEYVEPNEVEFYKSCKVIHLAGKFKPWKYDLGYLSILYKKYWDLSNLNIEFPKLEPTPERFKIKRKGLEYLFSVKNAKNDMYKILTIFFMTFKIKKKNWNK